MYHLVLNTPERRLTIDSSSSSPGTIGYQTPSVVGAAAKANTITLTYLINRDLKTLLKNPNTSQKKPICERLALYLSTERDENYCINLGEMLEPERLHLVREDRYTALVARTIGCATSHMTQEQAEALTEEEIKEELLSYEEAIKGRLSKEEQEAKKDHLEMLMMDMANYLCLRAEDDGLMQLLTNKETTELESLRSQAELENLCASDAKTEIEGYFADHHATVQETAASLVRHSAFKNGSTDPDTIEKLVTSRVDVDAKMLEQALQIGERKIIALILEYARYSAILPGLLGNMFNKLVNQQGDVIDSQKLLHLAMQDCFSDIDVIKEILAPVIRGNLFNSPCLREPPGNRSRFSKLFDENNQFIYDQFVTPNTYEEIKEFYLDSSADDIALPTALWKTLKAKAEKTEEFEILTDFFQDVIHHLTTKYVKNSNHYKPKLHAFLTTIKEAVNDNSLPSLNNKADFIVTATENHQLIAKQRKVNYQPLITKTQECIISASYNIVDSSPKLKPRPSSMSSSQDNELEKVTLKKMEFKQLLEGAQRSENQFERSERQILIKHVFSRTLTHLKNRRYKDDKQVLMQQLIQNHINGTLNDTDFISQLELHRLSTRPDQTHGANPSILLGSPVGCGKFFCLDSKTSKYLKKELKHSELLKLKPN